MKTEPEELMDQADAMVIEIRKEDLERIENMVKVYRRSLINFYQMAYIQGQAEAYK